MQIDKTIDFEFTRTTERSFCCSVCGERFWSGKDRIVDGNRFSDQSGLVCEYVDGDDKLHVCWDCLDRDGPDDLIDQRVATLERLKAMRGRMSLPSVDDYEAAAERAQAADLRDMLSECARLLELEASGVRDGNGYWHGSDVMDAVANEMLPRLVKAAQNYVQDGDDRWRSKHHEPTFAKLGNVSFDNDILF